MCGGCTIGRQLLPDGIRDQFRVTVNEATTGLGKDQCLFEALERDSRTTSLGDGRMHDGRSGAATEGIEE